MIRALYSARTGLNAQQMQLDVISNNLANVSTGGFKKSRIQFEDLFYQNIRAVGTETADGGQIPTGIQVGLGVKPTAVQKIFTQGDYTETGNDLDFAIEGRGFFQILRNGEEFYTRAGSFKRDSEGYIVTSNGDRMQPEFQIPEGTIYLAVDAGGLLVAKDENQDTIGTVQLALHDFINPAGLKSTGGNLFQVTDASGEAIEAQPGVDGMGTIAQRFLETSNVDVAEEMVNLIITQRAFEVNSKAVTTADQLLEIANSLKR
ncbi:MAG: flagellar basal-body rod protein FlgG [Desulfobulbaceae bacterium]|nr:flagellar basal-body rod protein FlgG [Desulfobulbaceae bacterium]MCK5404191.1 flagellar basal-body rod protein FlgG [Desulfobulbaceae bacterium]